ncbi:hypothetical protein MNBD_PLANCTO02-1544 [hydrothermal vent metagenome]|uniref:Uncharacterized protein n=1 Tax=hydrothermal vent metagenome TaxID=652676 RepID=A0A3B1DRA4_9ZZZZ
MLFARKFQDIIQELSGLGQDDMEFILSLCRFVSETSLSCERKMGIMKLQGFVKQIDNE